MAPKVAAMDTWGPHATVRIGLAVPGRSVPGRGGPFLTRCFALHLLPLLGSDGRAGSWSPSPRITLNDQGRA